MGHISVGPEEEMFSVATIAFYESIKQSDLPEATRGKILQAFSAHMATLVSSKSDPQDSAASMLNNPLHIQLSVPLLRNVVKISAKSINEGIASKGDDYRVAKGEEAKTIQTVLRAAQLTDYALSMFTPSTGLSR